MSATISTEEVQAIEVSGKSQLRWPKLAIAAAIVFSINVCLAVWFCASPSLVIIGDVPRVHAEEEQGYLNKMSPFEPVIVNERARKRISATRLRPVLRIIDPPTVPETTYLSGARVYDMLEKQSDYPRVTAASYSTAQPRVTEPASAIQRY